MWHIFCIQRVFRHNNETSLKYKQIIVLDYIAYSSKQFSLWVTKVNIYFSGSDMNFVSLIYYILTTYSQSNTLTNF